MVFRIFLANATAEAVAQIGQSLGLAGTVSTATGFGPWGIESTVVAEIGGVGVEQVNAFAAAVFAAYPDEEAVYVTTAAGTKGEVWWRDGRVE